MFSDSLEFFQQGGIERHAVDITVPVIAEQIGAQFVWREGISPHEAEFTVTCHRHFTFGHQTTNGLYFRFTAPSRLAGGFKHLHLTRGVVLQRQRLTVLCGDAVFCQRIEDDRRKVCQFQHSLNVAGRIAQQITDLCRRFAFLRHRTESGNLFGRVHIPTMTVFSH
ncbi:hypothetical protein EC40967_D0115 [Escherichia coli 4.0967]|uniref:Uncharacterized protein n=1 Tax=Escherichia coli 4.0967 TaxID=869687 RepID=A0AAN4AG49_ECOLX|nr:hypothetical protein EC40967_D0115 [Escherichia coli 4.0967]